MRVILCLAVLSIAAPARADSFVELAGGVSLPMGDDNWTDAVESSPILAVRAGAVPNKIGGFFSAEWMPTNTNASGWQIGNSGADLSAHRFRLIVGPMYRHELSNTLAVDGRFGIGADIAHASVEGNVGPISFDESETDVGLALDFAAGVWFRIGNVEVGGTVAIPFGFHDDVNDNNINFDWTSYDLQLLGAVRFMSH